MIINVSAPENNLKKTKVVYTIFSHMYTKKNGISPC